MTPYILLFIGWSAGALIQGFVRGGRPSDYQPAIPDIVAAALLVGTCWLIAGAPR